FLASSLARGEWPWWSPNVFAGWPQISDPQSLVFAPLYVLLAAFDAAVSLRAFDAVTFAYLFLGAVGIILLFHDRGWHAGGSPLARMRASITPLPAAAVSGSFIAAVPIIMTTLLAARSNRPEISFAAAAGGSIHPVHLLQFAFADLFGAMDPNVEYWAPQSPVWDAAWGRPGLYLSQNMGLLYAGALTL